MVNLCVPKLVCCAAFFLALLTSCGSNSEKRSDYSEKDVREFLKPGIARAEISTRFGIPIFETAASDGTTVLIYHRPFPVHRKERQAGFSGFKVYLRENKLISWDPIIGDQSVP